MFIREVDRKYHHTTQDVERYALEARDIAARIFEHEEDRRAVLPTLVNLLASSQVWYEQGQPLPAMAIPRNSH